MTPDSRPLILHVIHHLVTGGLENGLVNIINHLPESRFRHAVACIEDYSDFRKRIARPDVDVIAMNRSRVGVWGVRREIYRLCRRLRPAIVHSRNLSGLDALLPARLAGVRHCIHGEHGWDVDNLKGEKWKPVLLRRLHSPLVDRYITVSNDLRDYLINRVGISRHRISQIYNGVDTMRFFPREAGVRGVFPEGFVQGDGVVIGTVGRLQPVKDQATLIHAFAKLVQEYRSARLVIVGDGPLLADLRSIADATGVRDYIWFAGARNDVPALLRAFDLFVLPSLSEGISNTILEAMACGLPAIATAVGGNPELIQDGESGRLFKSGDTTMLSRILADYVSHCELRLSHGQNARREAVDRFSLHAMIANYQSVYEQFI